MLRVVIIVLCLVLLDCALVRADDPGCYTSGSVAGIVIATVVVTLVMGGLAAAFIWYLWKQRKANYDDTKSMEKAIVCPPMSPDKQMIARESNDYAFDNPYFKDDETDTANIDAAEKGESGFRKDNGDVATVQNVKASNGTTGNHQKKNRPFSSLPFHAVFHPSGKKQPKATTMDDTYISKHLERITVPLRGHDFTGLGFNICGNMRDGIFVKDVLHRGPASESGKIKAGDRIVGVTVSFAAMVYEDALTILSYASPYDVKLEIEKAPATATVTLPPSSPKRLGASTSFRSNGQRRLFHPLYRSQSIDDLTQIGKDGFGIMNTSGSQRDSSSSATPKRSQSVEASNGGLKTRPAFIIKSEETKSYSSKGSRKSSTSSCESTAKAVTPTEKSQPALVEEPCTKKEAKSARFRAEQVNVKAEAKVIPPAKPARDSHEDKQKCEKSVPAKSSEGDSRASSDVSAEEISKTEMDQTENLAIAENEADVEKPTAPPRKLATPKRRAPAPPPNAAIKTETSAVVHQTDIQPQPSKGKEVVSSHDTQEIPPRQLTSDTLPVLNETLPTSTQSFTVTNELHMTVNEMPVFCSTEKIADPGIGSSDTSSLASGDNSSTKMDKEDQNTSPGKRKASSLGDLTKLEHGAKKKTSVSSAILERAVSLDLQQSIPGENLTKHKKILRAPAFEDDYLEDREDLSEINGQGLKRWDGGLDKVLPRLQNGDSSPNDAVNKENDKELIQSNYITKVRQEEQEIIQNNQEINPNEPRINHNEPRIDDNEPGINLSEIQIKLSELQMNHKKSQINHNVPEKTHNDSEISHRESEINHKGSENNHIEPEINHIELEINHNEPEFNLKESKTNYSEPEIYRKESKNIQSEPDINHNENLSKEENIKTENENKTKTDLEFHKTSSEIHTNPEISSSEIHIDPEISHSEINTNNLQIGVSGIDINPKVNHNAVDTNPEINHTEVNLDVGISKTEINLTSDTKNLKSDFNPGMNHTEIEEIDTVVITKSSHEKPLSDLKGDILVDETLPKLQDSVTFLTSTPVKKVIQVKNLVLEEDDDDIDDVPYLASAKPLERDESTTKYAVKTTSSSTTLYSPVTISIPVIKPDLTHFEKLPSPPPANTHPSFEPSWKMTKTITSDENGKTSLEKISVQSLYKPIFTSKEINNIDEPIHQGTSEKLVNGNESDASEHYSTAHENTSTSSLETSSLSVTLSSPIKIEATKKPNTIAGFAKTLIIPGPNDVENLLSLADEPNTPPMTLESPSKALENE